MEMVLATVRLSKISSFPIRSPVATDSWGLILCWYGNGKNYVGMGDNLDAASSGSGCSGAGGVGSGCGTIEDACLRRFALSSNYRSYDTRSSPKIQYSTFGNHPCDYTVIIFSRYSALLYVFIRVEHL